VGTDAGKPAPAFAVSLWFGIFVVRPWYAIRRALGWRQATRRQRFTVVLGGLCALSVVAGAAVAAARRGKRRSIHTELKAIDTSLGRVAFEFIIVKLSTPTIPGRSPSTPGAIRKEFT
jgi:hypothetical protein